MIRTMFRGVLLLVKCMLGIIKFLLLFVGTFIKLHHFTTLSMITK